MAKKRPPKKNAATKRTPTQRQIDKLDREILALVNRRAELAARKAKRADDGPASESDAAMLNRLLENNAGPLSDDSLRAVFRELISGSREIARSSSVAFLGPEYTYSHLAAIERFGQAARLVPVGSIAAVFEEVQGGQTEFGLVPIENSTDGRVADTLHCLAHSNAKICGEVPLRIRLCLLGIGSRDEIQCVVSKSQPLSQCRNWLSKHMPHAELRHVASTAEAARIAAGDRKCAAIASRQAGVNHSLSVLARHVEDNPDNVTRFAVIGTQSGPKTGQDKTSIVFEIKHQPGALADAMGIFKRQRLNLTWIESFPVPGQRGRYLFFVEFQGHASELRARRALESLEKKALWLRVLGSYAQADPIG